jgi:thioester reductase-like protein
MTEAPNEVAFFTGFPGFIGERLLPRLLELQPGSRFHCLVQDRFLEAARRSVASLEEIHPHTLGRIELVPGDITQPQLGIEAGLLQKLRGEVTSAYHLAAVYDLAVSREVGLKVNVEGTRHVVELLQECPSFRRLHYVSTAYVSGDATGVFRETDLEKGQGFKNYYEETKYLAEVVAVRSGLSVSTYRPAIVMGDSRTGETAKFDGPYFTLSAMEKVPSPGLFLRVGSGRNPANLVPVDFIVEALAMLASSDVSRGLTYNLTDPRPLSVFEVGELLARELGKRFAYVPVPTSVAKAVFRPRAVQRFFGMPVQSLDYFDHPCQYDCTQATRDLGALGVTCPPFASYVKPLVAFYLRRKGAVRREAMV